MQDGKIVVYTFLATLIIDGSLTFRVGFSGFTNASGNQEFTYKFRLISARQKR